MYSKNEQDDDRISAKEREEEKKIEYGLGLLNLFKVNFWLIL